MTGRRRDGRGGGAFGPVEGAVDVAALDPDHPDAGVAAHYGDPNREQRLLATEVGLVDRSHRGVLSIAGEDRLPWLHSLTSQHLTGLPRMSGTELLVLSPHGHIEHHAGVFDDGTVTLLDVEPGTAEQLLSFLSSMVFLLRVRPEDATDDLAVLSLVGPATPQALAALGVPYLPPASALPVPGPKFPAGTLPATPSATYPGERLPAFGGFVRRTADGADLLVPREAVRDLARAAGVSLAGIWAYEALRVTARRPRLGFDTDHRTLPAEVGWYSAVHLEKGCYRGQESVARIHNLGRPPRRLVLLHFDGISDVVPPVRHAPVVTTAGQVVGTAGTGAVHFELGVVGLALIRGKVPDDARLRVGAAVAAIDPLDPESAS
jgi:folate-binding protein YgfZ